MRHARPRARRDPAAAAAVVVGAVLVLVVPIGWVALATSGRSGAAEVRAAADVPVVATITAAPPAATRAAPRAASGGRSRVRARAAASKPAVPASFAFVGSGWGHGVGMSQVGAFGMASEGASATKILKHYYTGVQVRSRRDDVALAVNVAHGARGIRFSSAALASKGGAITVATRGNGKPTRTIGTASDEWTASSTSRGITVRRDGKVVATKVREVRITWAGTTSAPKRVHHGLKRRAATALDLSASSASVNPGHRYRYGRVTLFAHAGGGHHIEAVNTLRLHREYLRGLGEVPSVWPDAALQAQVVAARSYALVKYSRGIQAACDCHIDDGHGPFQDQNFVGYSKETDVGGARWVAAVSATSSKGTRGRVVLYGGEVAQTFYFASSGGRTESSAAVWGRPTPYLRPVDDHWSTDVRYNPTDARWGPQVRSEGAVAVAFRLPNVVSIRFGRRADGLPVAVATSRSGGHSTVVGGALAKRLRLHSIWLRSADPRR